MTPAWRIAPPRSASSATPPRCPPSPARQAPTGAPRPLVRSSQAVSNPPATSLASMPLATTAFISRAPSRCVAGPARRRRSSTARSARAARPGRRPCCRLLDPDQPRARRVAAAGPAARIASWRTCGAEHAAARRHGDDRAGERRRAAGLGDSGCGAPDEHLVAARRMCSRTAIALHIVPEGRKSAASWPSSAATRSSSARGRVLAALLVADLGRGHGGAHRSGRTGLRVGVEVDERHRRSLRGPKGPGPFGSREDGSAAPWAATRAIRIFERG